MLLPPYFFSWNLHHWYQSVSRVMLHSLILVKFHFLSWEVFDFFYLFPPHWCLHVLHVWMWEQHWQLKEVVLYFITQSIETRYLQLSPVLSGMKSKGNDTITIQHMTLVKVSHHRPNFYLLPPCFSVMASTLQPTEQNVFRHWFVGNALV